jgi:hypothetical protein
MRADDQEWGRAEGPPILPTAGRIHALAFAVALLLGSLFDAASAIARPQDEVLSAAFRCAAIGDLRIWLDCYYGAAQPQRAALGLPPVPAAQARLAAAPPAGNLSPQDIELHDDVLKSALDCNRITAGRDWLNCFYAAAEPVRARLGLVSQSKAPANPMPAPPASAFGLAPKPIKTPNAISAHMASYEFNKDHLFTVTLDNGQVWQQIEGDDRLADWSKAAPSYAVVISRGMFGSYNFRVLKTGALFKVRRLR